MPDRPASRWLIFGSFNLRRDRVVRLPGHVARQQSVLQCGQRALRIRRATALPSASVRVHLHALESSRSQRQREFMRPSSADEFTQASAFIE